MKFIGAIIWAFSDPDKGRTLNVLAPMGGSAQTYTVFVMMMRYSILAALFITANYFLKSPDFDSYRVGFNSFLFACGFLKLSVGRVIVSQKKRTRVFSEAFLLMVGAVTINYLILKNGL